MFQSECAQQMTEFNIDIARAAFREGPPGVESTHSRLTAERRSQIGQELSLAVANRQPVS